MNNSTYTTENQRCRLIPIGTRIARGLLFILIPEWHSNQDQEIRISSRLSTANCRLIYFGWYIYAQRTRRFSSDAHRATYITRINSEVRLRPSSRRELPPRIPVRLPLPIYFNTSAAWVRFLALTYRGSLGNRKIPADWLWAQDFLNFWKRIPNPWA